MRVCMWGGRSLVGMAQPLTVALGVADEFSNELAAADPDLATSARRALDIADEYCRLAILWSGVLDVSRLDAWLYVADDLDLNDVQTFAGFTATLFLCPD